MDNVQEFELLEEPKTESSKHGAQTSSSRDKADMSRLGKKQVLKVHKHDLFGLHLLRPIALTPLSGTLGSCRWWALAVP